MVAETKIQRQEFNDITVAQEYAYQVGQLLKDKLGKLLIKAYNYYPTSAIQDGVEYSIEFEVTNVSTNTTTTSIISHVASSTDSVKDVLEQLGQYVEDNLTEALTVQVYVDSDNDNDMYMTITPRDGYYTNLVTKTNMSSDDKKVWTETDIPACYLAYGKQPESSLPRVIITPLVSSTVTDRMEEGTEIVDGVEREFTSSYINYSINLTCEAGSTEEVMRTGISSQNILNTFRRMMTNEIVKKGIQNSINSVCYPLSTLTPLPKSSYTQWMDSCSTIGTFSCVDVYYPEVEAGWIDEVIVTPDYQGGTASEDAYDNFDKSRSTQVNVTIEDADLSEAYEGIDKSRSVTNNVEQTKADLTNAYDDIDKLTSVSSTVTQDEVDLTGVYDNIDKTKTFSGQIDKVITDFSEAYTGYDLLQSVQVNVIQTDTIPEFEESTGGSGGDTPDPDPEPVVRYSGGVQLGDIIIHSESVWTDHLGDPLFTLLDQDGQTFDETLYPNLFELLGTNVLEDIDNAEGSEVGYKRAADYVE